MNDKTQDKLKSVMDALENSHKAFFKQANNIAPMFLFWRIDNDSLIPSAVMPVDFKTTAEKEAVIEIVSIFCLDENVYMYAFISEAWMVKLPAHDPRAKTMVPSKSELRQEVLITQIYHRNGETMARSHEIERDWNDGSVKELKLLPQPEILCKDRFNIWERLNAQI